MAAIDVLGAMYAKRKDARRVLEAEMRAAIEKRLESLDRELSEMVLRAHREERVPIARIAREMGCSRTLVYRMIEEHAGIESALGAIDPLASRYTLVDGNVQVTLDEAMLQEIEDWWDVPMAALAEAVAQGYGTGVYEVVGGNAFGLDISGLFGPFAGRKIEHPVALWMQVPGHRDELVAWFRGQA